MRSWIIVGLLACIAVGCGTPSNLTAERAEFANRLNSLETTVAEKDEIDRKQNELLERLSRSNQEPIQTSYEMTSLRTEVTADLEDRLEEMTNTLLDAIEEAGCKCEPPVMSATKDAPPVYSAPVGSIPTHMNDVVSSRVLSVGPERIVAINGVPVNSMPVSSSSVYSRPQYSNGFITSVSANGMTMQCDGGVCRMVTTPRRMKIRRRR